MFSPNARTVLYLHPHVTPTQTHGRRARAVGGSGSCEGGQGHSNLYQPAVCYSCYSIFRAVGAVVLYNLIMCSICFSTSHGRTRVTCDVAHKLMQMHTIWIKLQISSWIFHLLVHSFSPSFPLYPMSVFSKGSQDWGEAVLDPALLHVNAIKRTSCLSLKKLAFRQP